MSPDPVETIAPEFPTEELGKTVVRETNEKTVIVYENVFLYSIYHISALYGLYIAVTSAKWQTILLAYVLWALSIGGTTVGSHRLWTHRAYKAKMPLQILLMICTSIACQGTATNWIRDHRMHHKYSDTNADPHNAKRGFFFSHIGWLLTRKHSELKRLSKTIYMDDIYNNPVLRFQKKYAGPVIGSCCFILPTLIPMYFWNETLNSAWHLTMLRFVLNIHAISLVNSVAHKWGYRPYDKKISPVENSSVSFFTLGEGFHNYHHAFPWDYKASELGNHWLNPSAQVIDFFAWIGWAYDLKTVPDEIIQARMERAGDGTNYEGGINVKNKCT
ncbi:unnamed protein product [Parnassius apollo]|uniref:(apollo) hypothetical protein n=1 Tax=Parnassius apollo TaxID=110799 RepID=A0A8S3XNN4_PARAO|nr:unnamed protein product [Parnassius apollo]